MKKLNKSETRVFRAMTKELRYALEEMQTVKRAISVFGSARLSSTHPYALQAEKICEQLSKAGYDIITGSGPGVMEAANRGTKHTESIGLAIRLPMEQDTNKYVTKEVLFKYFAIRKVCFIKYAKAVLVFPGGFGSMDEAMEALTLIQTGVIEPVPIIFINANYWSGLFAWIKGQWIKDGIIGKKDLKLLHTAETTDEVIRILKQRK